MRLRHKLAENPNPWLCGSANGWPVYPGPAQRPAPPAAAHTPPAADVARGPAIRAQILSETNGGEMPAGLAAVAAAKQILNAIE